MRCSDFHERINDLLDKRIDPTKDVVIQKHTGSCEDCRRDLQGYQVFLRAYKQRSRVVKKPRAARFRGQAGFWPIVAATLLVALTFASLRKPPAPISARAVAMAEPQAATNVVIGQTAITDNNLATVEPQSGYNFVQPILGLSLVANADWSGMQPVEMPFGVHVPQLETDWMEGVASEMVPIKRSVDSTVALIVRTLST